MLFSRACAVLALASAVVAAPYEKAEKRWWSGGSRNRPWWSSSASSSYLDFGRRTPGADSNAPSCALSNAQMPTAPAPLPSPASGLSLHHVAIGRGTQNYTCDLSNSTAIPVAIGAKATLFNVSCIAADQPELLSRLPEIALNLPIPDTRDKSSPAYLDMSGHHFFTNLTTAYFDLDTSTNAYGQGAFKKVNSTDAPSDAMVGQYGKGHGAVAWLKLNTIDGKGEILQEVYRLNTAGGMQPKTCTGMAAEFEIEYSAEYWIWS
ncbi:Protein of unknown function (DUF3455) [Teratosphaeria destructans]|uniref:Malate dehydrogenase n=1 Tax=Teratosphaeria destructans TaxID=418781 RepID=A0A9W7W1I4_9PEZI|nr:Protein of unknown function (DUF3455) [Teratosphaeria destructans]